MLCLALENQNLKMHQNLLIRVLLVYNSKFFHSLLIDSWLDLPQLHVGAVFTHQADGALHLIFRPRLTGSHELVYEEREAHQ